MIFKECNKCLENKPISSFYRRGDNKSQYRSICKVCMNKISNKRTKIWRHEKGISKKYIPQHGLSQTKKYKRLYRQRRKYLMKGGGELSIKTIQQVYEDNIKTYGTLTCYLCLNPIEFGKDNLEHKIPLSRGGTNSRDNLDIACQRCNFKKNNKTEIEYRNIGRS